MKRLRSLSERAQCRVGRHRWGYFIDGSVGRACEVCPAVQYDLPMHGMDRLPNGAPTNRRRSWS